MKKSLFAAILITIICVCFVGCDNKIIDKMTVFSEAHNISEYTLYINEFATSKTQTLYDDDGDFVSWVEIYNYGDADVSMKGLTLTDNEDTDKWSFPDITVRADGYMLVYLSGKDKEYKSGETVHADFSLSGKEDYISIFYGGDAVDTCNVVKLVSNLTYGRTEKDKNTFCYFPKATPLAPNTIEGFEKIESANMCKNKELVVSEVAAVNMSVKASDSEYYDYIEIYNPTDKPVSLSSYRLSDSDSEDSLITLPNAKIDPKSYFAIYCSDKTAYDKENKIMFLDIGLNRYGETIYLTDKDNTVIDSFKYGRTINGYCCGRDINASTDVCYFDTLTPEEPNPNIKLKAPLDAPEVSCKYTYTESGTDVTVDGGLNEIRYTTDGSLPTEESPLLTGTFTVNETVTAKFRCFSYGYVPSETTVANYIVGRQHSMPVIFLSTDSDNLFSENTGILADGKNKSDEFPFLGANFWKDWERPISFEYVDENGTELLSFDAGIKVFGQYSRAYKQKSLSINLRDKYGPKEICYPFFDNCETNIFSSLVLRNSGQDNSNAFLRDAFCASVIKNKVDVSYMDYKPVVVYINGEYYGIYELREKIDEDYLANHEGIDPDNVDIIKGAAIEKSGTIENYEKLIQYVKTHDMTKKANYDYVCSIVDIDSMISFWMVESFFNNTDTGNIKFYRERTDKAKWRWAVFDMDWALSNQTYKYNMVESYLDPRGHGVGKMFSTTLMCRLIKNKDFKKRLIEINSENFTTTFDKERMLKIYDGMVNELKDEMPYHIERWGAPKSIETWNRNCKTLRNIISERPALFRDSFSETFNLTDGQKNKYFPLS